MFAARRKRDADTQNDFAGWHGRVLYGCHDGGPDSGVGPFKITVIDLGLDGGQSTTIKRRLRDFPDGSTTFWLCLPWDIDTAEEYVRIYAKKTDQQMLQKKFHAQVQGNDTLLGFIASPFQLTLLVYLLEDGTLLPDAFTQSLVAADLTIYKLYEAFSAVG